ncbi:hypothetical protein FACS189472_08470 [Alphaproteobacteria bacterium]|nr:hypothetical protein FACS189472_08470 [Alphaproteobacteria bacterium]
MPRLFSMRFKMAYQHSSSTYLSLRQDVLKFKDETEYKIKQLLYQIMGLNEKPDGNFDGSVPNDLNAFNNLTVGNNSTVLGDLIVGEAFGENKIYINGEEFNGGPGTTFNGVLPNNDLVVGTETNKHNATIYGDLEVKGDAEIISNLTTNDVIVKGSIKSYNKISYSSISPTDSLASPAVSFTLNMMSNRSGTIKNIRFKTGNSTNAACEVLVFTAYLNNEIKVKQVSTFQVPQNSLNTVSPIDFTIGINETVGIISSDAELVAVDESSISVLRVSAVANYADIIVDAELPYILDENAKPVWLEYDIEGGIDLDDDLNGDLKLNGDLVVGSIFEGHSNSATIYGNLNVGNSNHGGSKIFLNGTELNNFNGQLPNYDLTVGSSTLDRIARIYGNLKVNSINMNGILNNSKRFSNGTNSGTDLTTAAISFTPSLYSSKAGLVKNIKFRTGSSSGGNCEILVFSFSVSGSAEITVNQVRVLSGKPNSTTVIGNPNLQIEVGNYLAIYSTNAELVAVNDITGLKYLIPAGHSDITPGATLPYVEDENVIPVFLEYDLESEVVVNGGAKVGGDLFVSRNLAAANMVQFSDISTPTDLNTEIRTGKTFNGKRVYHRLLRNTIGSGESPAPKQSNGNAMECFRYQSHKCLWMVSNGRWFKSSSISNHILYATRYNNARHINRISI